MDETDFPEDLAVRVRNVGKTYRLGVISRRTLRDELVYRWLRLRGRDPKDSMGCIGGGELADPGLFHALDDVSFDIRKGETVGLVGRNGAGKSTMLKILARITTPTTGEAWIRGRVGSMLEVGTGFHPELTGRENIYLNGTILGMTKQEIDAKFDEIVEFSEIGEFLDTPVKRYSSGMYVKLAFSIASSLDNDVLLLDEVLAVGDAAFREKSLARMKKIADSGRTILFVSHSTGNIKAICSRCLLFDRGRLRMDGETDAVLDEYGRSSFPSARDSGSSGPRAPAASVSSVSAASDGSPSAALAETGDVRVRATAVSFKFDEAREGWDVMVDYETSDGQPWRKCRIAVVIRRQDVTDTPLLVLDSTSMEGMYGDKPAKGRIVLSLDPGIRFPEADYQVDLRLWSGTEVSDDISCAALFSPPKALSTPAWKNDSFRPGLVNVAHRWSVPYLNGVSSRVRNGTGAVRVKSVSFGFDGVRDGWNVFVDYETADGTPWTQCRAAVVFRPEDDSGTPLCTFDSVTTPGLYKDKPPRGRIVLELPSGVRFPEGRYRVDTRLWVSTSVADDFQDAAFFSPDPQLATPGWRSQACFPGRVNLRHAWRVEVAGTPHVDAE